MQHVMKAAFALGFLLLSSSAYATFQPYVEIYDPNTHSERLVKNCVAPVFGTLQPQPGFTAAQTCNCNWNDDGRDLVLTCYMPSGLQVMQTADARIYMLVFYPGTATYVPVQRTNECR